MPGISARPQVSWARFPPCALFLAVSKDADSWYPEKRPARSHKPGRPAITETSCGDGLSATVSSENLPAAGMGSDPRGNSEPSDLASPSSSVSEVLA